MAAGACVASLGWWGEGQWGWLLLAFGPALLVQRTHGGVLAFACGYYLALGWESVPSLVRYFDMGWAQALLLWLAHALLNACAWWIPFLGAGRFLPDRGWRAPLALVSGAALSLCWPWEIFSWNHPLLYAGALFPGAGGWGVLAVLTGWILVGIGWQASQRPARKASVVAAGAVLMAAAALLWSGWTQALRLEREARLSSRLLWHPVSTAFGPARQSAEIVRRGRWFSGLLDEMASAVEFRDAVVVLPEGVLGPHRESLLTLLAQRSRFLQERNIALFWHADVPEIKMTSAQQSKGLLVASERDNIVASSAVWAFVPGRDRGDVIYRARVPVPWSGGGVEMMRHRRASPVVEVDDVGRVVFGVCYEGFLLSHWIRAWIDTEMGEQKIDKVVGMASLWFLQGFALESAAAKQRLAFEWGASLLGADLVLAVNKGR
jgi:hypothetical protein